ncbi:MAG: Crp/Fnr family transcriptional regulator [Rubrivivax sp.]|nr:Crp/Fnr family transcriptional regulator [Rubrivivax sp.]
MQSAVTPLNSPPRNPLNARCSASDVLHWAGVPSHASLETDAVFFGMRRVLADGTLVREGQPFESLHLVSSGSFKHVQTDLEGYEQVLGFAIHGDIVGLDALGRSWHASSAIALEDSTVVVMPLRELLPLCKRLPALELLLHRAAGTELLRRADTQYLMSAPISEVRVARFLLQLARRQSALGHSDRRLRLYMTRRDIASYLGVAHETVSRALTALVNSGCIGVSHRDIEIIDETALRELQRVTRGRSPHEAREQALLHSQARAQIHTLAA